MLGDLPHVPLLGRPSEPEPLAAAAQSAGINSFEVWFWTTCMQLLGKLLLLKSSLLLREPTVLHAFALPSQRAPLQFSCCHAPQALQLALDSA